MIKLDIPVIVEGKYDKITLENVIDAPIFKTDGFGIFKNAQMRQFLKRIACEKGIIVLTDSDSVQYRLKFKILEIFKSIFS